MKDRFLLLTALYFLFRTQTKYLKEIKGIINRIVK